MKTLLNKLTAVTSICVLALCSASIPVSADDTVEVSDITISFDYTSDEGIVVMDEYKELLEPVTISPTSSITIPTSFLTRDGYYFSGWTYDGIHAYTYGDVFRSPDGNDVTLKPVWELKNQEETYKVEYVVEIDGEILDTSKELKTKSYYAGSVIEVSLQSYSRNDASQYGWDYEEINFRGNEKFIMPEHDVTLTPHWNKKYKITYTVGDVDRVVGATFMEYEQPETIATGLQASNRFSRNGFTISGWLCDDDNQIYAPNTPTYIMPSHDVTFTAVWSPTEYTVVFKQDNSSKNNIKIKGFTDTAITAPEATITQDGQYLSGWQDEDGTVYPVGSEYMIKGAIAGKGIVLTAVWEEGTPPETTTTTTETTTTTTTTTATSEQPTETTTTTTTVCPEILWGDANDDGKVNISDAVLIMQSLANPNEYKLSETGAVNADVADHGDGITAKDALVIQQVDIQLTALEELPLYAE